MYEAEQRHDEGVLPVRLTSFVGREAEQAELVALLAAERMVTVAGPGGAGKTSLAAAVATTVADSFPGGLAWADLAPLSDADRVPYAAMAALGLGDARGLDPLERITDFVADRRLLLVCDNCEHVAGGAAKLIVALTERCPAITVVATSREPLGVAGELVWRVPALTLPALGESRPEAVLATEAGRLFADRAREALRGFRIEEGNAADVAALCHRLDGLPLAIELAAARVRSLRPDRILAGLDQRFRLLTGGHADAMAHQQTLAASVEWSHALLSDRERALLRRLSVFAGSFDLEAAEAVTVGELLESWDVLVLLSDLVERSLVVFDGRRYRLLETIREFALAGLSAAGEDTTVRAAHLTHFAGLAARSAAELATAPQVATLDALGADYDNLTAAIEHALRQGADETALCLVGDLAVYWLVRGRYAEALTWSRRALAATSAAPTPGRLRVLWCVGQIGLFGMDLPGGFGTVETAAAIEAARDADDVPVLVRALAVRQFFAAFGAPEAATAGFPEVFLLEDRADDPFGTLSAHAYAALSWIFGCDRPADAAPHLARLAAAAAATGSAYWGCWHGLGTGLADWRAGRLDRARGVLSTAWERAWEIGDPMLESWCAVWLCDVLLAIGADAEMEAVLARSLPLQESSTIARTEWLLLRRAALAQRRGDPGEATRILAGVQDVIFGLQIPFLISSFDAIGVRTALATGDLATAQARAAEAVAVTDALGTPWWRVEAAVAAGRVARARDEGGVAEDSYHRALALCAGHGFDGVAAEALEQLASLAVAARSWTEAARLLGAAETLRRRTGHRRSPIDEPAVAVDLDVLRAELGAAAAAAALADGAALDLTAAAAYASRARGERKRPSTGWASLTPTERQVVDLVAEGLGNAAIAARLFVTTATAKTHLHHAFTKLGIANRTQLAAAVLARRHDEARKDEPARP